MSGWIKLHRKITEWEWYSDLQCRVLFLHLLVTVENEPKTYRGKSIPKGSRVAGRLMLSEETGLSQQELRTAMKKLSSTGDIEIEATSKFSIITVCNYSEYQKRNDDEQPAKINQQNDTKSTSKSTKCYNITSDCNDEEKQDAKNSINQHSNHKSTSTPTTSKEVRSKEVNTLVKERFDLFWEKYPRKVAKKIAFKAWEKQKCHNGKFEDVMIGVEAYRVACEGKEQQFIAHPASWINAERWDDEISTTVCGHEDKCPNCRYRNSDVCKRKSPQEKINCTSYSKSEVAA